MPDKRHFRGVDPKELMENYREIRDIRTGLHAGDSTNTAVWVMKEALAAVAAIKIIQMMRDAGMAMGKITETLNNVGIKLPSGIGFNESSRWPARIV